MNIIEEIVRKFSKKGWTLFLMFYSLVQINNSIG